MPPRSHPPRLPGSPFQGPPPPPPTQRVPRPLPNGTNPQRPPLQNNNRQPPPPRAPGAAAHGLAPMGHGRGSGAKTRPKDQGKKVGNSGRDPGYQPPSNRNPGSSGGGYGGGDGGGGFIFPGEGGGGGGEGGPEPITWSDTYERPANAPAWWRAATPSGLDPNSTYAMLTNALIPYMSPEDQRIAAGNLAILYPDAFAAYTMEKTPAAPVPSIFQPAATPRHEYLNQQRATDALATLERVRAVMNKPPQDLGPGYQYLRNIIATHQNYGGTAGAPQSRAQYQAMMGALDPLLGQAKNENLSAYGPVAQAFALPFSNYGPLRGTYQDESGRQRFSPANPTLF